MLKRWDKRWGQVGTGVGTLKLSLKVVVQVFPERCPHCPHRPHQKRQVAGARSGLTAYTRAGAPTAAQQWAREGLFLIRNVGFDKCIDSESRPRMAAHYGINLESAALTGRDP